MLDKQFDKAEFWSNAANREVSPAEFMQLLYDPSTSYEVIQNRAKKVEAGVSIEIDGSERDIIAREKVDIFQSVMQYVEAFGIYLIAYIKGREGLVDHLIRTQPREVKTFFEDLETADATNYLAENNIDTDLDSVLTAVFGYQYEGELDVEGDEVPFENDEPTQEEIEELVDASVGVIDQQLRHIGHFYIAFDEIYNAVKHGNRVISRPAGTFKLTPEDGDSIEIGPEDELVTFLCKNRNGDPYFTTLPANWLMDYSLRIAEKVNSLFSHIQNLMEADIEDGERYPIRFYTERSSGQGQEHEWVKFHNQDMVLILPKTGKLAELQPPTDWERMYASRVEVDGDVLVVRTGFDREVSREYPVMVSLSVEGTGRPKPERQADFNMTFSLDEIDCRQYENLVKLGNDSPELRFMELDVEGQDTRVREELPINVDYPDVKEPVGSHKIELLALLQRITDRHIPAPFVVSQAQLDLLEESEESGTSDLTQEEANEIVDELQQLGNENEYTVVVVEKYGEDGETIESETCGEIETGLNFDLELQDPDKREALDEQWGKPGVELRLGIKSPVEYDQFVSDLRSGDLSVLDFLDDLELDMEVEPEEVDLVVCYGCQEDEFWFTENELRFEFYE